MLVYISPGNTRHREEIASRGLSMLARGPGPWRKIAVQVDPMLLPVIIMDPFIVFVALV